MARFLYHRRFSSLLLLLLLTERELESEHTARTRARYDDIRAERIKKKRGSVVFVSRYKNKKYALPREKERQFSFLENRARAWERERERGCAPLQRQAQCKPDRICNHAATVIEKSQFFFLHHRLDRWTPAFWSIFFRKEMENFCSSNQNTTPTYA